MSIEERTHAVAGVNALWYTRCPVPTASSLAIDYGWLDEEFERDGITVSSLRASGEQGVRESHFDHTKSNSFRQGGNIPPIWTRARGGDTALVALSWVDENQAIISMPESGIRTVRDLGGRRLALPRRLNDQIDFWRAMCLRPELADRPTGPDEYASFRTVLRQQLRRCLCPYDIAYSTNGLAGSFDAATCSFNFAGAAMSEAAVIPAVTQLADRSAVFATRQIPVVWRSRVRRYDFTSSRVVFPSLSSINFSIRCCRVKESATDSL